MALALAAPAVAQRPRASIDAGALTMQYADSIDSNAIALTPAFWIDSHFASLSATGTLSRFGEGAWSLQGSGDGSLFTRRFGIAMGELQGTAGGSTRNDGSRTGQLIAIARGHISTDKRGAWIGAGLGATWDGVEWRNVQQGEAAAWARAGNASALLSITPISVDDTIKYFDTELSAGVSLRRIDLSITGGVRGGSNLPTLGGTATSWGSASATGWILPRLALVASAGTYPVDLTQGFPGGRFASLSIRVGSRRFSPSSEPALEVHAAKMFEVKPVDRTLQTIRIRSRGAETVELMGDFTDWAPVKLDTDGSGWWSVTLPVTPGLHEMNMRIDGGRWVVPAGMARKSDEFGGTVGVFLISM
jgi:hypothetical protein